MYRLAALFWSLCLISLSACEPSEAGDNEALPQLRAYEAPAPISPDASLPRPPEPIEADVPFDDHPDADPWAFAAFGRWSKPVVTWRVDSAPGELLLPELRVAVRKAASEWSAASSLRLEEAAAGAGADIVITAERAGDHGDVCPFDSSTLAHAFFPGDADAVCPRGKIHVNRGQRLTLDMRDSRGAPYDLHSILLHEIGHALGLGHSSDPESVMWSMYSGTRRTLAPDDVAGMLSLYSGSEGPVGPEAPEPEPVRWLGPPAWETPRCVMDQAPVVACFESRGLVYGTARVTVLEWDKHGTSPVGWIDVIVAPEDVDDATGVATTCVEWTAAWEPDGSGQPEFVARVVVAGLPAATMSPDDADMLHVGKSVAPCAGTASEPLPAEGQSE